MLEHLQWYSCSKNNFGQQWMLFTKKYFRVSVWAIVPYVSSGWFIAAPFSLLCCMGTFAKIWSACRAISNLV
jgi:hypothetical protein